MLGPLVLPDGSARAQNGAESQAAPRPAWPSAAPSQGAPKAAWPAARPDVAPPPNADAAPGRWAASWWQLLLDIQHKLHRRLAEAVKSLKTESTLGAGFVLVAVSFLYGVFHAAGPGHGKAVISSYVLANGATVRRGITLSFLAAIVRAITAIAIVSILAIFLNAAGIQIRNVAQRFETASGLLIGLTGLWLLLLYLRKRVLPAQAGFVQAVPHHHHDEHEHHAHHHHDEACGCGHAHMPDADAIEKNWSLSNAAAIVFAIGIRPCTGAILVLVFALTQGLFWAGVGATFAMAIGTAITVSALAVLAVGSRDLALRFAGSRWAAGIYDIAAIGGSLLVMLLGAGLFWSSLGPAKPF
jgi:ABC-type nickel/cobalt efflux system permease component RcnA